MTKKWIAGFLALLFVLPVLGCRGNGNVKKEESALSEWTIVYPQSLPAFKTLAESFRDEIEQLSGVRLTVRSDYQADDGQKEILLGETNRTLSDTAYKKLTGYEFRILMDGNQIALAGKYQTLVERAVRYFSETYVSGSSLSVPAGLDYVSENFDFIELAVDKKSAYRLVYPEGADDNTRALINGLIEFLIDTGGTYIEAETDDLHAENPGEKEILFGRVNRAESEAVYSSLPYHQYQVIAENGKVILAAWSPDTLESAVTALKKTVRENTVDKNICIDPQLLALSGYSSGISKIEIPAFEGGTVQQVFDCNDSTAQLYITDTTAAGFAEYCTALEAEGYICDHTTGMGDNLYAIYHHDEKKQSLFVNYSAYNGSTKIMVSPLQEMLPTAPEETRRVTTSLFAMMDLGTPENGATVFGASLVIRLEDGRFVVIDGGTKDSAEIKKLYDFMSDNNVREDGIVIAAWILTHPHSDHWGCFYGFSEGYRNRNVKLEKVIYNIYADSMTSGLDENSMAAAGKVHNTYVPAVVSNLGCNSVIKVHTGQKFYLGNVLFEVLYTHEDLYPNCLKYVNDASIVLKVTIGETTFLLTGDIEAAAAKQLLAQMGDYIKTDYIQIAHHGWGGTSGADFAQNAAQYLALYQRSGATYALWTAQLDEYHYNMLNSGSHMAYVRKYIPNIISTRDGMFVLGFA